jgi:hypothetical protein
VEVLLDGKKPDINLDGLAIVADVLKGVDQLLSDSGRVRTEVKVDGEVLTEENVEALIMKPVGDVAEVRVSSVDAGDLARQTLMEAKIVLPEIKDAFEKVSYRMQAGKKEEAFDELQQTFMKWRDIIQLFSLVEGFLKVDFKVTFVGEKTIDEINNELLGLLNETKNAMVNGDLVTLSDLLEYEIAPKIDEQLSIIDELLK